MSKPAPVAPIPPHYSIVTPYLIVRGASEAISWYRSVFGAKERMRMEAPGGKVGHAELDIGGCVIMLADEHPEMGVKGPFAYGGSPVSFAIYVTDCDAVFEKAVVGGATVKRPLANQFYGDRSGMVTDPFGHTWSISTHVEDVSPAEMAKRAAQAHGG